LAVAGVIRDDGAIGLVEARIGGGQSWIDENF
jgi:hypothetical protein